MKAKKYLVCDVVSSSKEKNEYGKYRFDFHSVQKKYLTDGTIVENELIESASSLIVLEKGPQVLEITESVYQNKITMTVVATHKAITITK